MANSGSQVANSVHGVANSGSQVANSGVKLCFPQKPMKLHLNGMVLGQNRIVGLLHGE